MKLLPAASLILLAGCALSSELPPVEARTVGPMGVSAFPLKSPLPAARHFEHHRRFTSEVDSLSGLTRVAITTHSGRYFLWIQRPRLTFFYVYAQEQIATPDVVSLVFRTQSPQDIATNRLTLSCDGRARETSLVPRSRVESGVFVNNHFLAFDIPTPAFADFISCASVALDVGGIRVEFAPDQVEAMRDLGSRLEMLRTQ